MKPIADITAAQLRAHCRQNGAIITSVTPFAFTATFPSREAADAAALRFHGAIKYIVIGAGTAPEVKFYNG